ncbi:TRAPP trafficking subunit Trs65-domain-containing protein [Dioszegia hungarica]|uniref:TRAPP trafficking subunit Trs65-domain-containing protein n=1 Tax=Dioszegia hungarica TaxID=4972 RepID=A0AA38LTV2_9TREE|nr:TRAPP trafficking subunit Trs65-domain-containing protein [Dioszegia hungarica]KAI9633031.1 TRAPP trafficking subunit Trs65-domain-containing protein [Dioszegia hungarica]
MEAAFNACSLKVYVQEASALPDTLFDSTRSEGDVRADWEQAKAGAERDVAFFDEKLIYFLALFVPGEALEYMDGEGEQAVLGLVKRIQRTMTSSFLPPTPPRNHAPHSRYNTDPTAPSLGIPTLPETPLTPGTAGVPDPATPNPFPAMRGGEEEYADVEGVTVWEGDVGMVSTPEAGSGGKKGTGEKVEARSVVRRVEGGYEVIWEGEVPVAYVRTQIQNPLLALTASITLRPDALTRSGHRSHGSVATLEGSVLSDGEEEEGGAASDEEEEAWMMDIDLLGGLAGTSDLVPATRLGPSARQDLSISDSTSVRPTPLSAVTPVTAPHHSAPPTASPGPHRSAGDLPSHLLPSGSTMRKSFRRVLSLSPGLRVRMRNLVLPQLIPPSGTHADDFDNDDGENKVVLCVEIENAPDGNTPPIAFVVSRVEVEIGGKGGKATAALTCQPTSSDDVFPLRLQPVEQYNLLYGVTVASTSEEGGWEDDQAARAVLRNLGTGEVNRPVSIMVIGRPYYAPSTTEGVVYPTREFSSRWNCNLDLSAYYASLASGAPPPMAAGPSRQRTSKPVSLPPANAIVGDKRYSLATLLAGDNDEAATPREPIGRPPSLPPPKRLVSGRPLMPSQLANQAQGQNRLSSLRTVGEKEEKPGLMVSVRLLDRTEGETGTIKPLEEFSVEVYVQNRTEEVRRFRLSVPGRQEGRGKSAPGVIPLENDIRCGPLLPGASMSSRIRFMALRDGVHRIEKLRVTGVGDDVDFIVSPVLDVVIGSGID